MSRITSGISVAPFQTQHGLWFPAVERPREPQELRVEVVELGSGSRDLRAARSDSGQEVGGHLVAAAFAAHSRETAGFVKVEAQSSERHEDAHAA